MSRRYIVVVNPASGRRRGKQTFEQVRRLFDRAGAHIEVHICDAPGHARKLARTLNFKGYDGCCVIGGDGTFHEVVNGLLSREEPIDIPLGLIPAGSGNALHRHQGGCDVAQAAQRVLSGKTCPLDVAEVTSDGQRTYCVNIVGWGAVSDINGFADKLRFIGPVRYAVSALRFIFSPRPRHAHVVLDDHAVEDDYLFVIGCITRFTGNGMMLAPDARIDDGLIDVVIVRPTSRRQLLKLFSMVFDGSYLSLPCAELHQVRHFAVEQDDQAPLTLDGEAAGKAPFSVNMLQGPLRIFT